MAGVLLPGKGWEEAGGLFRVVGMHVVAAFDGELCSIVIVTVEFRVVGLRMVAAFGGTLGEGGWGNLFSIIMWTSITTWIATWRTSCLHEGLTVHLHLG